MKNYARPTIEIAQHLSEGVYLSLSGDTQVGLQEALEAANGEAEDLEVNAADITGAAETQEPADEAEGTPENAETEADLPETNPTEGVDADSPETDLTEGSDADASDLPESESMDTSDDQQTDTQETDVQETGEQSDENAASEDSIGMAGAGLITCDSDYMNGVWQAGKEGAWGSAQLGCKEVWGCTGCPADKGNGCGLQDPNAVSLYFRKIGTLKPTWETSGKLPTDNPYGI